MKKKWEGNKKKRFYSEIWKISLRLEVGGRDRKRGAFKNPVGLCMYEGHMDTVEYIWVSIWCMFDWILSPKCRNTLYKQMIN